MAGTIYLSCFCASLDDSFLRSSAWTVSPDSTWWSGIVPLDTAPLTDTDPSNGEFSVGDVSGAIIETVYRQIAPDCPKVKMTWLNVYGEINKRGERGHLNPKKPPREDKTPLTPRDRLTRFGQSNVHHSYAARPAGLWSAMTSKCCLGYSPILYGLLI